VKEHFLVSSHYYFVYDDVSHLMTGSSENACLILEIQLVDYSITHARVIEEKTITQIST
jgi:hypothetical protein